MENLRVFFIMLIVFTLGSVVMGFEMLISRYLYPYFGGGIETWGALISTVLAALMVGYYVGGFLADRFPSLTMLSALVLGAAGWIAMVPLFADWFLPVLLDFSDTGAMVVILASMLLTFVPLAFIGTLLPFIVKVVLTDVDRVGRVAGLCYAVSTFGNICGILIVTFYLIPTIGVRSITEIIAGVTVLCAGALFLLRRR